MITHTIIKYIAITMIMLFVILYLGLLVVFYGLAKVVKPLRDIVRKADQLATHRWTPPDNEASFPGNSLWKPHLWRYRISWQKVSTPNGAK